VGVRFVDKFRCDYACRTVGESIIKHHIPNDWYAEFDVCDGVYPIVCIQVDQNHKASAMMDLKLRVVENKDDEYAACIVHADQEIISFKIDHMEDLAKAMEQNKS